MVVQNLQFKLKIFTSKFILYNSGSVSEYEHVIMSPSRAAGTRKLFDFWIGGRGLRLRQKEIPRGATMVGAERENFQIWMLPYTRMLQPRLRFSKTVAVIRRFTNFSNVILHATRQANVIIRTCYPVIFSVCRIYIINVHARVGFNHSLVCVRSDDIKCIVYILLKCANILNKSTISFIF